MRNLRIIILTFLIGSATVQAQTDREFVDRALVALDISPSITIVKFNRKLYNGNVRIYASVDGSKGSYTIFLHDDLKGSKRQRVIAHELIHIKEREEGNLHTQGKEAIYKGYTFKNFTVIPYKDRPWEEYAFKEEGKLLSRLRKLTNL